MADQPFRNLVLRSLPAAQREALAQQLEPVDLAVGDVIERPDEPIEQVYFFEAGLASVIAGSGRRRIEAGLFGRDGLSGLAVLLGSDRSPHETMVQMAGHGHRMDADALRAAMDGDGALREALLRCAQAFAVQATHAALANGRFNIEARLARWLLMCHDRADGDRLQLKHEFLATMLGVRRAGVTVALHVLEGRGLIRSTRGEVRVLDRDGLVELADGSYGVPEAEYERLMGLPIREAR